MQGRLVRLLGLDVGWLYEREILSFHLSLALSLSLSVSLSLSLFLSLSHTICLTCFSWLCRWSGAGFLRLVRVSLQVDEARMVLVPEAQL